MMTMRHHGSDAVAELSAKSLVIMRMAISSVDGKSLSPKAHKQP